jgi:hypothetical protein
MKMIEFERVIPMKIGEKFIFLRNNEERTWEMTEDGIVDDKGYYTPMSIGNLKQKGRLVEAR